MKEYQRLRNRDRRRSDVVGIVITVALHTGVVAVCANYGLKYLDPPPPEDSFVLDFTEYEEEIVKPAVRPVADRSPYESVAENLTPETRRDDFGDIDTPAPEPEKEPVLDARASFPGMARKDTSLTAPHSAAAASEHFRSGDCTASLGDRSVDGAIAKPDYRVQEQGKVVVTIWVDRYGKVQNATPGAGGTTVTNRELFRAAREAALKTRFTMSASAPEIQQGSITYIFKLQ